MSEHTIDWFSMAYPRAVDEHGPGDHEVAFDLSIDGNRHTWTQRADETDLTLELGEQVLCAAEKVLGLTRDHKEVFHVAWTPQMEPFTATAEADPQPDTVVEEDDGNH